MIKFARFGKADWRLKIGLPIAIFCAPMVLVASPSFATEPLVKIESDGSDDLRQKMSDGVGEVDESPRSRAQARRRAKKSVEVINSVLRSEGFYQAQISVEFGSDEIGADTSSRIPVVNVIVGPQFSYGQIAVDVTPENEGLTQALTEKLTIEENAPASSQAIVTNEVILSQYLKSHGYPDANIQPREAVVDHAREKMDLTLAYDTGAKANFGQIQLSEKSKVSQKWIEMVAPFDAGDLYDETKVKLLKQRVISTGAFAGVTTELQATGDDPSQRDVFVSIAQGKRNSVNVEAGYSTTDGSGILLSYERRNLGRAAQTLTLTTSVKTNQQSLSANYFVPYAWRIPQSLDLNAEIAREDTDIFRGNRASVNALLTHRFSKKFNVAGGLGVEASELKEDIDGAVTSRAYLLEGITRAVYDDRDDLLDPKSGFRVAAEILPAYDFGDAKRFFAIAKVDGSTYWNINPTFTAAGRVKYGSIVGAPQSDIPLNKRFYGGGGGSVRGYGYQSISPESADGTLVGGRAILEGSAELRYRGFGNLGFVGFIDAASVSEAQYPEFDSALFGLGAGVRYYTAFAPLRADIAIPLKRRDGDAAVQIYLSIGQAF